MRVPATSLTSFIGRAREIADLTALLAGVRLVTLTGPGGIGKTRLAREVVRRAQEDLERPVAWASLSILAAPGLVAGHVAAALGVSDRGAVSPLDALVESIGSRRVLVVIDDCEHVVEEAAQVAAHLLGLCPGLTILATSRQPLGVPGERAWVVPALSLPADSPGVPEAAIESEAVRLFVDRAREILPSFSLGERDVDPVSQICRRLEGIPLAIELAAARIRALTPKQIAARLDDAFHLLATPRWTELPKHRTLRATVEWSYRLLPTNEQRLFRRLSVFRGGSTLEAVEAVCTDHDLPAPAILEHLAALVERSMVRMHEWGGSARYTLLETVRRYGEEVLQSDPEDARRLRRCHAERFVTVAENAAPRLERRELAEVLAEFALEQENLKAALHWASQEDGALALRATAALAWFWITTGQWQEGAQRLDAALAPSPRGQDIRIRARALSARGSLAYLLHDFPTARARYEEAVRCWRGLDEPVEVAKSLAVLAQVGAELGRAEEAVGTADEAVHLAQVHGRGWALAWVLACRGAVWRSLGRLEDAERAYAEAESAAREEGAPSVWLFEVPLGRALAALRDDASTRAAMHAVTAVRAARSMEHAWYGVRALLSCVDVASRIDALDEAGRLLGALSTVRRDEVSLLPHEEDLQDELSSSIREALGDEAFEGVISEGRGLTMAAALERAESCIVQRLPARALAAAEGPFGTGLPRVARRTVTALKVLALGSLEIYRLGRPLPERVWRYTKPRELLLYLLCHPRGRTREQIGLAFWPESSAARVKNNLHVALHRLRSVLEHPEWIVLDRGSYRLLPGLEIDFDADRFETGVTAELKALKGRDRDPAIGQRLGALLGLYRGDFLEAEGVGDWHVNRRDRLRRLFVEGQSTLAHSQLEQGRLEEACEAFERLLAVDELGEAAYRGLMVARARMGDRSAALRLYQRLASALISQLETTPAPETVDLADRLRRNEPV